MVTKMKKGFMDDQQFCYAVIENAFGGIAVLDGSNCVYTNKKFLDTLGYEENSEVIGRSLKPFVHPEDKDKFRQLIKKKRDGEYKPLRYEVRFIRKDGTAVDTLASTTQINYQDKKLTVLRLTDASGQNREDETLKERLEDLEMKYYKVNEINNSLSTLIKQKENEKKDFESTVLANIKELVMPYISELQKTGLDPKQQVFLDIIQTNLNNIVSPFVQKITSKYMNLTPTEIKIATFIKEGKTAKAIAKILNVSESAVNLHRQHVRDKLGLSKKKIGLRTYLLSMT